MKRTPNYGLPIVENNDRYSKEEQNNAMNIIDTELGSMSEAFRDTLNDIDNTFEEVKEFEGKIQADYDSLKKVIISENISVDLQNQINTVNTSLENIKKYCSIKNTPEYYGAKGDGVADDTEALQKCLDSSEYVVLLGKYKFTKKLYLNNNTIYGYGVGQLILDGEWHEDTSLDSRVILNKNFGESYNNPNTIHINGVNFIYTNNVMNRDNQPYYYLSLGNTQSSSIINCKFLAPNKTFISLAFFDGYGSNRNLIFDNNYIEMKTYGQHGGIWFRQIGHTDYSSDIRVTNNTIIYSTGDELFGVYSYQGGLKNVVIKNNTFVGLDKAMANAISICGNDETVSGGYNTAYLENVVFSDNVCYIAETIGKLLQISMECESLYIKNIRILNNRFELYKGSENITRIISVYRGEDILIQGNSIKNSSEQNIICLDTRVKGVVFKDNFIEGKYSNCIRNYGIIENNTFKVECSEAIFFENELVKNNYIYPQNSCRICQNTNDEIPSKFIGNHIETSYPNVIQTLSLNGDNLIMANVVKFLNEPSYLVYVGMWFSENTIIKDNVVYGATSDLLTPQNGSMQISGNVFYKN